MSLFGTTPIGPPGDGINPPAITGETVKLTSATARTAGTVVALDLANATLGLSSAPGGLAGTSIWNTVREITTATVQEGYPLCILEQDLASGGTGKATFMGIVNAKVQGVVAQGTLLTVDTSNFNLKAAAAGTDRICGINLAAANTSTVAVYFNGFCNLGAPVA